MSKSSVSEVSFACRDLGHAWSDYTVEVKNGVYNRTLRCTRCRTLKTQVITPRGELKKTSYTYVIGYVFPRGSSIAKQEIRKGNLSHLYEF